jgi:hypothetical protein
MAATVIEQPGHCIDNSKGAPQGRAADNNAQQQSTRTQFPVQVHDGVQSGSVAFIMMQ